MAERLRSKNVPPDFNQTSIRSNQHTVRCEGKRSDVLRGQTFSHLLPVSLTIVVNLNTLV